MTPWRSQATEIIRPEAIFGPFFYGLGRKIEAKSPENGSIGTGQGHCGVASPRVLIPVHRRDLAPASSPVTVSGGSVQATTPRDMTQHRAILRPRTALSRCESRSQYPQKSHATCRIHVARCCAASVQISSIQLILQRISERRHATWNKGSSGLCGWARA